MQDLVAHEHDRFRGQVRLAGLLDEVPDSGGDLGSHDLLTVHDGHGEVLFGPGMLRGTATPRYVHREKGYHEDDDDDEHYRTGLCPESLHYHGLSSSLSLEAACIPMIFHSGFNNTFLFRTCQRFSPLNILEGGATLHVDRQGHR